MKIEVWKEIVGFPYYEVSDLGNVRSWRAMGSSGGVASLPRLLKQSPFQGKKYLRVGLCSSGGVKHMRVHRLVLEAFVGPCPEGMEGCHNDGDPANNRLNNLRWDTKQSNHDDQIKHGTRLRCEKHQNAILTNKQALEAKLLIKEIKASGTRDMTGRVRALADSFGVTISCIYAVARKDHWVGII